MKDFFFAVKTSPPTHLKRILKKDKLCLKWDAPLPSLSNYLQYEFDHQLKEYEGWKVSSCVRVCCLYWHPRAMFELNISSFLPFRFLSKLFRIIMMAIISVCGPMIWGLSSVMAAKGCLILPPDGASVELFQFTCSEPIKSHAWVHFKRTLKSVVKECKGNNRL